MHTIIYCGKVEIMHLTWGGGRRMKEKIGKEQCYIGNNCAFKIGKNKNR